MQGVWANRTHQPSHRPIRKKKKEKKMRIIKINNEYKLLLYLLDHHPVYEQEHWEHVNH